MHRRDHIYTTQPISSPRTVYTANNCSHVLYAAHVLWTCNVNCLGTVHLCVEWQCTMHVHRTAVSARTALCDTRCCKLCTRCAVEFTYRTLHVQIAMVKARAVYNVHQVHQVHPEIVRSTCTVRGSMHIVHKAHLQIEQCTAPPLCTWTE